MTGNAASSGVKEDNLSLLRQYHDTDDVRLREEILARIVDANFGLVRAVAKRYTDRIRHHMASFFFSSKSSSYIGTSPCAVLMQVSFILITL